MSKGQVKSQIICVIMDLFFINIYCFIGFGWKTEVGSRKTEVRSRKQILWLYFAD